LTLEHPNMDHIQSKSNMARRRMLSERFINYIPYTLGTLLLLAALGVMIPKVMSLDVDAKIWYSTWIISAVVIGLIVNSVMTWMSRPTQAEAAAEVDHRFGLRERLSSSLMLTPQDRETKLGQALVADARRRAETLDIPSQFNWGVGRRVLVPILPVGLSLLFFVIPDRQAAQAEKTAVTLSPNQVKNSTQPLLEQIRKKREEAEKDGLKDALEVYKKLEGEIEKMQKDAKLDPKQALAKLNEIKDQLVERRKELGSAEALKKNLQNMEKFDKGPADDLTQALKKGDFEKAEDALQELMKKVKDGKLDSQQMEQLQKQMEQLSKSVQQSSQAHEQAKQNLKEQIKQAQKSGDNQQAGELQRKLEQLQAMDSSMAQMQQMADMLAQCQQCMKEGDQQGLQEAMGKMAEQLSQMNQSDGQLQDLDQLMDKLSQCKNGMCEGEGLGNMRSQIPGRGMGEGQGVGERPEEENDTDHFDSQVRDKMKLGETRFGGKIGGENRKNASKVAVQEDIRQELAAEPEPIDDIALPKTQREHVRNYNNSLREGKK
jgi:hypothetical protein